MNSIAHHTSPVVLYNDPFEVLSAVNINRHTTLCHLLVLQDVDREAPVSPHALQGFTLERMTVIDGKKQMIPVGSYPASVLPLKTLVVATELHRNNGYSITNVSEKLATEVVTRFRLDPTSMTFLEHYDDVISYGYRGIPTQYPDHYKRVEYAWDAQGTASRPSWSDFLPYEEVLHLLGSRVSQASQMAVFPTEDYEFIGVLTPQENGTQKQQWVILPDTISPGIDGPDMHVASYVLPFVKSHTYTPFIYGVSRHLSWETVNASLVMKTRGVRFYSVRRAFEVSL